MNEPETPKPDTDKPYFEEQNAKLPHLAAFLPKLRKTLKKILADKPVRLAYLFGSVATGTTSSFSDIDIALLVNEPILPLARLKLILNVQQALADKLGMASFDVRIINDAPLVFLGRVVSDGILIFARDERERVDFETQTRLRYFDYLPIHVRFQAAFFADIRERGLHG